MNGIINDKEKRKAARKKAEKIVSLMTTEEKMSQLRYDAPAIERLGIHEYNWWNEACHGVARSGVATVFPQSIGMAATFHPALVKEVADAISTEGRAKYNRSVAFGDRDIFKGLTYWAPNINIFRDPRWGRGQETCGEDPFLTAEIAKAFINGLQGDGDYYKATACAKHFAVHSGPEKLRHSFNAKATLKDMEETYLPAFKKAVETGVAGVMGAYNRTNGEPCCSSKTLIKNILRDEWGYEGYFVSDCGAITDICTGHKAENSIPEAAAAALTAGCELNCGDAYQHLVEAYEQDLITEEDITKAAVRLFTIRVLLGEFEKERPYADIPFSAVSSAEHKALNLRAAEETIVLLDNKNGYLPLDPCKKRKIAVVGPNAMSVYALEGNYNGHADEYVTVADGIRRIFKNAEITVADGSPVYQDDRMRWDGFCNLASEGAAAAKDADLTVLCLGLDRGIEGEDLGHDNEFTDYGDRKTLRLPICQQELAEAVCEVCENVIVVVMCGSCADLGERVRSHAKAVLHAWYPGALGGLAVARAIAGAFSPSGKLPITFYHAEDQLPDIADYDMAGRTYRFMDKTPLYPFGYGLSYTSFSYGDLRLIHTDAQTVICETEIKNTGNTDAWEKAQLYAVYKDSRTRTPNTQLCAVSPVYLKAGETKTVSFTVDRFWIKAVLDTGERVEPNGGVTLYAGGGQTTSDSKGITLQKYREGSMMDRIFSANWIKSKRYHKYCETQFRKTFSLSGKVKKATLSVTAHGVFVGSLNGKRIGEDILAPGWTVYDKRLQFFTYDVTDLLLEAENELLIGVGRGWLFHELKNWSGNGLRSDEAALICALTLNYTDDREEVILTDETWQTRRGRVVYNDIYNGETLDLAAPAGRYSPAVPVNYPKAALLPMDGVPTREQERIPGQKLIVTPKGEQVIDFGQEITGYVEFSAAATKGEQIVLKHFEVLDKAGNVYTENLRSARATYTVVAGDKPFTVKPQFTFYGFRYIQVLGIDRPDPAAFTAVVVHSEMKRTGHFSCSHPLLNQFVHNVLWGQKGNFLDVPTDCPQRDERLGWTGDAEVFCRTAAINYDVRSFFDKWLADLEADQRPDGAIPHVCPNPWDRKRDNHASPAWADAAVIIPWELYNAYGDLDRLRRQFPLMKKWVEHMISCCRDKGVKEGKEFAHPWTDGGFGDWLSLENINSEEGVGTTDRGLIATAYLIYDLGILIKTCGLLSVNCDYYIHVREDALKFFRSKYMKDGRMKQDTQTAEVLALVFELSDDPTETGRQLADNVRRHKRITTGFIGSTYLLDALTLTGEDSLAVDLLLREEYPSWLYPVTMGATTIWERWNGIFPDGHFADKGMNSFNHYAYGSVFAWMFRRLAGIRPECPGYRKIRFAPAPDDRIPQVNASIDTIHGTVSASYEKTGSGWRFTFTVPAGIPAEALIFGKSYTLQNGDNELEITL